MKKLVLLVALLGTWAVNLLADTTTLTLTEVSDIELDYSWSGGFSGSGKLTASSPDVWSASIPGPDVLESGHGEGTRGPWSEETPLSYNDVKVNADNAAGTGTTWSVSVMSDLARSPVSIPFPVPNGSTKQGPGDVTIQFFDNGDTALGVPDHTASASVLGLSFAACLAMKRKLR